MTETRHTASSINDAQLDALYEQLHKAQRAANLLADSHRRAEQAEAERDQLAGALDRVRALADEHPVGIDTALIHAALAT